MRLRSRETGPIHPWPGWNYDCTRLGRPARQHQDISLLAFKQVDYDEPIVEPQPGTAIPYWRAQAAGVTLTDESTPGKVYCLLVKGAVSMAMGTKQWLRLGKALTVCVVVIACGSRVNVLADDAGTAAEPSPSSGAGGQTDDAAGGTISSGGWEAAGGQPTLGVARTDPQPYACATATAAYYDEPPGVDIVGCRDIYNSNLSYPTGTIRTIVAPTSAAGATCSAYDCICEATGCWGPRISTFCQDVCSP